MQKLRILSGLCYNSRVHLTNTPAKLALIAALVLTSPALLAKPHTVQKSAAQKTNAKAPKPSKAAKATKPSKVNSAKHRHATYKSNKRVQLSAKDRTCLTRNVYYEARGESYAGKLAIAQVTGSRVKARGASICRVVYAPSQFSWTADPSKRSKSPRNADWETSQRIVQDYSEGLRVAKLGDATYFHATYLGRPGWTKGLTRRMTIGNHVFYE